MGKKLSKAVKTLSKALKRDPELMLTYQASITMSVSDAIRQKKAECSKKVLNRTELLEALNDGALNFLYLLRG